MKHKIVWILLFAIVLAGGAFFRLWRLDDRPMHTDEAVHAAKFGKLLDKGDYAYDPREFHGPTLNYFTLISSRVRGEGHYSEITETTLRLVPAVFGIALILTPLLFLKGLRIRTVLFSCILLAFSPVFIYYSRYYIQETLLLFFTGFFLGAVWNYFQSQKILWILLAGVCLGLMHATKETFVFAVIAAVIASLVCITTNRSKINIKPLHLLAGLFSAVVVSVLFYSSFGTNLDGVIDSVKTYAIWATRAGGQSVHIHPWYYYLDVLTWLEFIEPITWNEDGVVAFALIGLLMSFFKKNDKGFALLRFVAIYMFALTMLYSFIPYKTPWNMMSFVYGMAILAAMAADRIVPYARRRWPRAIFWTVLFVYGLAGPIAQSWMLNFNYAADPINPYVYAHTGDDIFTMVKAVEKATGASEMGINTPIQIIAAENDYWPFPWYLRKFPQAGYWSQVEASMVHSPIILANAECEQELLNTLYTVPPAGQKHLYVPLFDQTLQLRPGIEWRGYIRKDLWDQIRSEPAPTGSSEKERPRVLKVQPDKKKIDHLVKFSHRAMNANFEVFIQHDDGTYAGRAARAAFREIDRLEGVFSRFIENSDVSRINRLTPGEFAIVDEDTINCLKIARGAWQLTDGAFDVTIGEIITARKSGDTQRAEALLANRPSMKMLELSDDFSVGVLAENISVDLGGIGKGYAVDRVAEILSEWGVKSALIHAGASSVRAMAAPKGKRGWPVTLTNPVDDTKITLLELENEVLSCSGLQRGRHIINPFTGQPVTDRRACWIRTAAGAALADALTTAGMIMPIEKIEHLQEQTPEMAVMLLREENAALIRLGPWPDNR